MKYLPPKRRGTRLTAALALTAAASLAFAACGGGGTGEAGSEGSVGADEEIAVTLITKTSTNPFFIAMQKGAEEAGKANNVSITTAAGKADGDEATQIQALEAATARVGRRGSHHPGDRKVMSPAISGCARGGPIRDRARHPTDPCGRRQTSPSPRIISRLAS